MFPSEFVAVAVKHGGFTWRKEDTHEPGIRLYWDNETVLYPLAAIAKLTREDAEQALQFIKQSEHFMNDWQALPTGSENGEVTCSSTT